MRIIDADALPVVTECCVDEAGFFAKFNVVHEEEIQKAPTLDYKDLVPQGEWERSGALLECQCCGDVYSQLGGNAGKTWNFCPNCGTRMKGSD